MTDVRALRTCLSHFATGVTVVTCEIDGAAHGVTVSSFTSVSLDPALVLVSLARGARTAAHLAGRPFVVNVLRADQRGLALCFAEQPGHTLPVWESGHAVPRLAGTLATLTCSPWACYDGGDHLLFLGLVDQFTWHGGEPLIFYRGVLHGLMAGVAAWSS